MRNGDRIHVARSWTETTKVQLSQVRTFGEQSFPDKAPATTTEGVGELLSANERLCSLLQCIAHACHRLLLIPATTCTPERSFSSMRSLKSYLRSTITQKNVK